MPDFTGPVGAFFGPNSLLVTAMDEAGQSYELQVYPDEQNPELHAAGLPQQYYIQPGRLHIPKRFDDPEHYDFAMSIFKGLKDSSTAIGVSGDTEAGGGFITFSTSFGIPESVIKDAINNLKTRNHPEPNDRIRQYFRQEPGDPDPVLGLVPMTSAEVTIEVPHLFNPTTGSQSMFIESQGSGKASIEASGQSSFLISCNELAAGAIVGSLKQGVSPFTVHCTVTEQFYANAVEIKVEINVDMLHESLMAAVTAGGFLGINSASLSAAWSNCALNGGIVTKMTQGSIPLSDAVKQWVDTQLDEMRKRAYDQLKQDLLVWDTTSKDTAATTDKGWASGLFGGAIATVKADYQHREEHFKDTLILDGTFTVSHTISGDLNEIGVAVEADLKAYLAVVDIFEYFQKVQLGAMSAINWSEKLLDGTDLRDPLMKAQIQAAYPDDTNPVDANGQPNLVTLSQGTHYPLGTPYDPNNPPPPQPAVWTSDNAKDVVDMAWLRLDQDVPNWPKDQVRVWKTLVYDGSDPRVDLSVGANSDGVSITSEETTVKHAPIITAASVGYIFLYISLDRILPKDNVTVTLVTNLGGRTDTIGITKANQKHVILEIFSDKYFDAEELTYTLQVEVVGYNFTDDPVLWDSGADPITVKLPKGRIKYLNPLKLMLPPCPPDKVATVNQYIRDYPLT